jgi:predicted TIM-barrel fold metal-dependent hydrolase
MRIDVHHHAILPKIQQLMKERGAPFTLPWSLPETWEVLETNRIGYALVSNAIPGDFFDSAEQSSAFHRRANEAVAEFVDEHPHHFGLLAALPMPYVDAALDEVRYSLDELGAHGLVLVPHAADSYLGDPLYDPLFEELNRREAVVLVHPMTLPGLPRNQVVPTVLADFLLDTTRGAINLILSGALDRYPRISWILSHGGGFLPYAASRVEGLAYGFHGVDRSRVAEGIARFHYDLALSLPSGLPSLLRSVPVERILFGTDWSAAPADVVAAGVATLDEEWPGLTEAGRAAIDRDNALRLFPRVREKLLTTV